MASEARREGAANLTRGDRMKMRVRDRIGLAGDTVCAS